MLLFLGRKFCLMMFLSIEDFFVDCELMIIYGEENIVSIVYF